MSKCEYCGYHYSNIKDREHQHFHAVAKHVNEPKEIKSFVKVLEEEFTPIFVDHNSPLWKHKQIYYRARQFRREFDFDCIQWPQIGKEEDLNIHAYLFNDESGTFSNKLILGSCKFMLRQYTDHPPIWSLEWIWISKKARRLGLLSKHWDFFLKKYGIFEVSAPVSKAMAGFIEKMNKTHTPVEIIGPRYDIG